MMAKRDEIADLLGIISPLETSIKKHEGFRKKSYLDSLGNPTVGWGHLLSSDTPAGIEYPELVLEEFFRQDVDAAIEDFGRLPLSAKSRKQLLPAQQEVLIEMIFNMGLPKVKRFKKMLGAIERGDTETAAKEMMKSDWAKQVGGRARTLQKKFMGKENDKNKR